MKILWIQFKSNKFHHHLIKYKHDFPFFFTFSPHSSVIFSPFQLPYVLYFLSNVLCVSWCFFCIMNWIYLIKFFPSFSILCPFPCISQPPSSFSSFFFWLILTNIFHFINSSWYFPFTQITGIGNWCWIWADVAGGSQYYPSCINANVTLSSKYFLGSDFIRIGGWFWDLRVVGGCDSGRAWCHWWWVRVADWLADVNVWWDKEEKKKIILIYPVKGFSITLLCLRVFYL